MISSKSKSTLRVVSYSSFMTNTDRNGKMTNTLSTPTSQAIPKHQLFSSKAEYDESSSRASSKKPQQIQQSYMRCHNYFLRKSIMNLYKYFQNQDISWNLDELSHQQMLLILKELKYIKSVAQETKAENNIQLRKAYYLWVNLAQGPHVKLANIIIILSHIEKLECDGELIDEVIRQLKKGIQKFPSKNESFNPYPTFIFYCKKQNWKFANGLVTLNAQQIEQVQKTCSCFLYTRWTQMDQKLNLEQSNVQNGDHLMSKKSIELATTKRQRILEQIRQIQPQIQSIQLHHILNYKEKECLKKTKNTVKTEGAQLFVAIKKGKQNKKSQPSYNLHKKNEEKSKLSQSTKVTEKNNNNKSRSVGKKKIKQKQIKTKDINQCYQQQIWNKSTQIQKDEIIDQLQWQQIPRKPDDIAVQNDLFNLKSQPVTETLSPAQSNLLLSEQTNLRQKKRRQYIDLPILYVDVNIEQGKKERIVIYEGDKARQLAIQFGQKHGLSHQTIGRLEGMLEQQIGSVLSKIDQAFEEDCSYLF